MSPAPAPAPSGGALVVPLPIPPAIGARLPPRPPAGGGDGPRLRLGADAGLRADDLRAALRQQGANAAGEVARDLQELIAAQAARDASRSNGRAGMSIGGGAGGAGAGGDDGEGADESYAGPDDSAAGGVSGTGSGTKRGRGAADADQQDSEENDDDDDDDEGLLAYHPDATFILRNSYAEADDGGEDNGAAGRGHLFVTTRRILFVSDDAKHDAAVDAGCIVLHALSECEERGWHVYCQLEGGPGGGADGDPNGPDEAYVYPSSDRDGGGTDGQQRKDACQRLFDAFGALASLNPIHGDDEDNAGGGGGGGLFGMMSGMGGMMMGGADEGGTTTTMMMMMMGGDGDGNDDEMVCRLGEGINPSGGFGPTTDAAGTDGNGDGGAAAEERAAMLERLDGMLVVPAEYEIASGEENENHEQGGQFDDAEESGDELL